ncbi:unnamed protein product [Amoebophrya sp. A25]|nr:unnamed protein product [Amoebophrya sp. A25]|eukprot:GSA25T00021934001.1
MARAKHKRLLAARRAANEKEAAKAKDASVVVENNKSGGAATSQSLTAFLKERCAIGPKEDCSFSCSEIFCELANFSRLEIDLSEFCSRNLSTRGSDHSVDIIQDLRPNLPHTGGIVWETSYLLCWYMLEKELNKELLSHDGTRPTPVVPTESRPSTLAINKSTATSVLELGAGCGFLGIALAKALGERASVVLTEYEGAMDNLRKNVALNLNLNIEQGMDEAQDEQKIKKDVEHKDVMDEEETHNKHKQIKNNMVALNLDWCTEALTLSLVEDDKHGGTPVAKRQRVEESEATSRSAAASSPFVQRVRTIVRTLLGGESSPSSAEEQVNAEKVKNKSKKRKRETTAEHQDEASKLERTLPAPAQSPPRALFDYIVATDVIFDKKLVGPLLATLHRHAHGKTRIFLCVQERCQEAHREFLKRVGNYFTKCKRVNLEEAFGNNVVGDEEDESKTQVLEGEISSEKRSASASSTSVSSSSSKKLMPYLLSRCSSELSCLMFRITRPKSLQEKSI